MKNLKKVLALVVVFSMMLSTVAFAAFPDVDDEASYKDAVNTLAALGIIGGDDQGNFNPDNTITRAEFTKIVCEMQGLKSEATKGATAFTDVAAEHWASGYINMATQLKIINGMGDGTFAPEAPVTYEQAIKMIMVALGYEPMAAEKGGYPTGYIYAAQAYGVTKGIVAPGQKDPAIRSLVAELVYNALDCPMMEQVDYGTEKSFVVMDGITGNRVTLLSSKFDVVKLDGVVIANSKVSTNYVVEGERTQAAANPTNNKELVVFAYNNNYKSSNIDFSLNASGVNQAGVIVKDTGRITAYVGETDADEYFGIPTTVFVQEKANDLIILAINPIEGRGATVTFPLSDVDLDPTRTKLAAGTELASIAYYESETARRSTMFNLSSDAVIWNNDNTRTITNVRAGVGSSSATVTVVDWNADEIYDLVLVDEFTHYVVDAVEPDLYAISTLNGDEIRVDEDDDIDITMTDVDGNAITLEDIAVGDVLAVVSDNPIEAAYADEFIKIINLGATAVEGTVKAVDTNNAAKQKIYVEDVEYILDAKATANGDLNKAREVGSEGIFYIGMDGQIVAFDGSKAAAGNFALILQGDVNDDGFNEGGQLKILNKNGEAIIYNVAKQLKIKKAVVPANTASTITKKLTDAVNDGTFNGTDFAARTYMNAGVATPVATLEDFINSFDAITFPAKIAYDGADGSVADGAISAAEEALYNADVEALKLEISKRVVQVKVNSSNEIVELAPYYTVASGDTFDRSWSYNTVSASFNNSEYVASTNRFQDVGKLDPNAVIFSIDVNDINKSKVLTADALVDEANYNVVAYGKEDTGYSAAVLLAGGNSLAGVANGWAVVTGRSTTTDDEGNDAVRLTVVSNSQRDAKTILVTEDTKVDTTYNDESDARVMAATAAIGSVILYAADEAGEATIYAAIADVNAAGNAYAFPYLKSGIGGTYDKTTFKTGITVDALTADLKIWNGVAEDVIDIEGSTYEYRYNNANIRNPRVEVGTYKGGNVTRAYWDDIPGTPANPADDTYRGNTVLARIVEGEVVDIISIDMRNANVPQTYPR